MAERAEQGYTCDICHRPPAPPNGLWPCQGCGQWQCERCAPDPQAEPCPNPECSHSSEGYRRADERRARELGYTTFEGLRRAQYINQALEVYFAWLRLPLRRRLWYALTGRTIEDFAEAMHCSRETMRWVKEYLDHIKDKEAEMAMRARVHVTFLDDTRRWRALDANQRRSTGAELILEADGTGTLAVWAPEGGRAGDPYDLALTRTQVDQLREVLGPPAQRDPDEPVIDNSRPRDQLFRSKKGGT